MIFFYIIIGRKKNTYLKIFCIHYSKFSFSQTDHSGINCSYNTEQKINNRCSDTLSEIEKSDNYILLILRCALIWDLLKHQLERSTRTSIVFDQSVQLENERETSDLLKADIKVQLRCIRYDRHYAHTSAFSYHTHRGGWVHLCIRESVPRWTPYLLFIKP